MMAVSGELRIPRAAVRDRRLHPAEFRVLMAILDAQDGPEPTPTLEGLAHISGCAVRTVHFSVHKLAELGYVTVVNRGHAKRLVIKYNRPEVAE